MKANVKRKNFEEAKLISLYAAPERIGMAESVHVHTCKGQNTPSNLLTGASPHVSLCLS